MRKDLLDTEAGKDSKLGKRGRGRWGEIGKKALCAIALGRKEKDSF